jgi:hypothetical protein
MRGAGAFGCLPVRLVHWFIENPDETLTTADVRAKFALSESRNLGALKPAIDRGLLVRECAGQGKQASYGPGPKLLGMLRAGASRLPAQA